MAEATNTISSQQPALLLCCLASLGAETFAGVLLPKLVRQGSAADVALTCSQLRDLCHGSVQRLDLTTALKQDSSEPSALATWTQHMPQHFSNCTSAGLRLHGEGDLHALNYLLTALSGLPKLDSLDVKVEADEMPSVPLAMALHAMRTQLQQLRCLNLDLNQDLRSAHRVWDELGNMTQLTALCLHFYDKTVSDPLDEKDVLPLRKLHSLQDLCIISCSREFLCPLLSAELAAGLTSLTALVLDGCPVSVLEHVSSCVALRSLCVGCATGSEEELGPAEWAVVGCLTGLTELQLENARFLTASPECCAAVNSLSRLQVMGADLWSANILSAFSSCMHLTEICGHWTPGDVAEGVVLPSVVSLGSTGGSPPLAAFPNLTAIMQDACLSVDAFGSIAQHCTGLTELTVAAKLARCTSLPPDEAPLARIGAVKSLSALTQLTRLDFMLRDNAEMVVLTEVAAVLLPLGLKRLGALLLYGTQRLSVGALMHLAKLRGLQRLTLELFADRVVDGVHDEAADLLAALSGIMYVELLLPDDALVDVLQAAEAKLREWGLPCPGEVKLRLKG